MVAKPANLMETLARFSEHLEGEMSYLSDEQHDALMRMVLVRGCAEMLHARGSQFGWPYPEVKSLRSLLTHALVDLTRVPLKLSSIPVPAIAEDAPDEETITHLFKQLT